MAKIDIISQCLVKMATRTRMGSNRLPTAFVPSTLELTPWDLWLLLVDYTHIGLLFRKPNEPVIDRLKNSLSRTLSFFPPLSGRIGTTENGDNTTSFFTKCNDEGAGFTHAVPDGLSIANILEPKYKPEILKAFYPLNNTKSFKGTSEPLLGVQVTELADGLFIGCAANHAIMDGFSFWHFIHSWSEISRGLDTISKAPVFEPWFPSSISEENRLLHLDFPRMVNTATNLFTPCPLLERIFTFKKDDLARLKAKANAEAGSDNISTFQALAAHLWRSVLWCRHQNDDTNNSKQEVYYSLVVGARPRIPLPDGYFGNAIFYGQFASTKEEILQNGLGFAAKKISELVRPQTREAAIIYVESCYQNRLIMPLKPMQFVVAGSSRYDNAYGCDFGWGKPMSLVRGKGAKIDGMMTFYPTAEPGGIEVEVCLAPKTMEAMENHPEFLEAVTI